MNSYLRIEESMDERLLKNRSHPQWAHILNKEYCNYMIKRDAIFLIEWAKSLSSIQKELFGVPNNNIVKEQNKFKKIHQGKN